MWGQGKVAEISVRSLGLGFSAASLGVKDNSIASSNAVLLIEERTACLRIRLIVSTYQTIDMLIAPNARNALDLDLNRSTAFDILRQYKMAVKSSLSKSIQNILLKLASPFVHLCCWVPYRFRSNQLLEPAIATDWSITHSPTPRYLSIQTLTSLFSVMELLLKLGLQSQNMGLVSLLLSLFVCV